MERFLLAVSLILVAASPASFEHDEQTLQTFLADPAQRLAQLDREESNGLRIMNVAAHPDDEDGSSLTFLHRHYGYRVHIVYATRGEGGQNEIGPELGDALGVIRSQECQAAAEGYGASISFLNALDFGYSKTAEETLEHWDFQTLVQRMMAEIRWFRPEVILTHHTPDEGHGQHRATSFILREACNRVHQLDETWLPLLLERTEDADAENVVDIDAGQPMDGLPWTYAGLAYVALRRHRSQGMALDDVPTGPAVKHYRPAPGQSLPNDGRYSRWRDADTPWAGGVMDLLLQPRGAYRTDRAETSCERKRLAVGARYQWTILHSIPLGVGGSPPTSQRMPEFPREGSAILTHPTPLQISQVEVTGPLPPGLVVTTSEAMEGVRFGFRPSLNALPDQPPASYLRTRRTVADSLDLDVTVASTGHEHLRVAIPPRDPEAFLQLPDELPPLLPERPTVLQLVWWGIRQDLLTVDAGPGVSAQRRGSQGLGEEPTKTLIETILTPDADATSTVEVTFRHPLLTRTVTFPVLHLKYPPHPRVGFIEGVDGSLRHSLENAGLEVVALDDLTQDLSGFATILVDVRAYLVRDDLKEHNDRLLEYMRNGGHLVVQYQKTYEWNVDDGSPWPPVDLLLSHDRVVDETATVTPEHPEHPFWHYPHELRREDWDGWIQERGLYFPTRWDPALTSLVSMHDKGEAPLEGSILVGDFGDGHYTYTSLVWYRELRAAVPGAYRAFFNLLFWPQAKD